MNLLQMCWLLEEPVCVKKLRCLTTKAVQGATLTLQGIDNVHCGHGLALGMFGVGDGITDHILQEDLENPAGLLIDETRDSLHTTTAGETTDGGLGDSLDVIAQNLPVALGTSLSETLASFSATRHG